MIGQFKTETEKKLGVPTVPNFSLYLIYHRQHRLRNQVCLKRKSFFFFAYTNYKPYAISLHCIIRFTNNTKANGLRKNPK